MLIELQNELLTVQVRPERGGRIDQIFDRRQQRAWLWHPAGYDAELDGPVPAQAEFDAFWTGGLEEMFPNDGAAEIPGRHLLDYGELWRHRWALVRRSLHELVLSCDCETVPVTVEKHLRLLPDQAELLLEYRLHSRAAVRLPYMLKLHPSLVAQPGDRIELPSCHIEPVDLDFSTVIGQPGISNWPWGRRADGSAVRLDEVLPQESGLREFIYASNLSRGRCALRHQRSGSCLEILFDRNDFPYVWVFASYGGFNGQQLLVLEPCTSKPWDLGQAMQQGTAAWLQPGEVRQYRLILRVNSP